MSRRVAFKETYSCRQRHSSEKAHKCSEQVLFCASYKFEVRRVSSMLPKTKSDRLSSYLFLLINNFSATSKSFCTQSVIMKIGCRAKHCIVFLLLSEMKRILHIIKWFKKRCIRLFCWAEKFSEWFVARWQRQPTCSCLDAHWSRAISFSFGLRRSFPFNEERQEGRKDVECSRRVGTKKRSAQRRWCN